MADPQWGDEFPEDEDEGGGESTVSMASPTLDPAMPSPISVPPPPGATPAMPGVSMPTAPTPFSPPVAPAFPGARGPALGGIGPAGAAPATTPKPLPAAGAAPPQRELVTSGQATGAGMPGMPPGMKRPVTVIGLAPPPVGAPRPGQAGARVPLPSGKGPTPAGPAAPRPAAGAAAAPIPPAPASDKGPPSSARGGGKAPSAPKAVGSSPSAPKTTDADATDENFAIGESVPDSQKEDMATMAKSPEESLALFGLDSGLTNAARAAVVPPKPGPAAGAPPTNRSPLASTNLAQNMKPLGPGPASRPGGGPPPLPPSSQPQLAAQLPTPAEALPVLHDRSEEEESTRAVSREEMLRGHDAVIIGEEGEGAQGEDATVAVSPGLNEANTKHIAALAEAITNDAAPPAPPPQNHSFTPPGPPPQGQGFAPPGPGPQGWSQQPQPPMPSPQGWQDPNAFAGQPPGPGPQSYPGMSVGPVSGPHMPAQSWTPNAPPSQPHFPGAAPVAPGSNPHLGVPQSGHMMAPQPSVGPHPPSHAHPGPIPYPGQPNIHQPPPNNPFGDWNANAPQKPKFKLSGQILLLAVVGTVCLAIFVTGIVLFVTTKF